MRACPESPAPGDLWEKVMAAAGSLPPFSPVLHRLLAALAEEEISISELSVLIERDAVLAGNTLRLANSALYGRRGAVNSVRHAVSLMGVVKLRNFVLGLSVARFWSRLRLPAGWSTNQFNRHSIAAGLLADLAAMDARAPYPEGAFVAGLLHDIGEAVIAVALPGRLETHPSGGCDPDRREGEVLGFSHAQVSGALLKKWGLPAPIQLAAAHHHEPDRADGGRLHLAHVLAAVETYLGPGGGAILPPSAAPESSRPLEELGLGERAPRLLAACQEEFEVMAAFL
ncbi:MAG: HDOD domain-containing protein [Bryobacterales bacterium]|nr:HDOD domain-containing protein [Bryobacterales bacterium]